MSLPVAQYSVCAGRYLSANTCVNLKFTQLYVVSLNLILILSLISQQSVEGFPQNQLYSQKLKNSLRFATYLRFSDYISNDSG